MAILELPGHTLPLGAELAVVCVFAAVFLGFAIKGFGHTE